MNRHNRRKETAILKKKEKEQNKHTMLMYDELGVVYKSWYENDELKYKELIIDSDNYNRIIKESESNCDLNNL